MHLRHEKTYTKNMTTGSLTPNWQRTYLCIGGIRIGVLPLADTQRRIALKAAWRWSWRGIEVSLMRLKFWVGWMAPQFRESN